MRFLATDDVCVKQRRSQLVVDLFALLRSTSGAGHVASLNEWNDVRGHSNKDAGRQDLHRTRDLLRGFYVPFEFGTPEGSNEIEVDLRSPILAAFVTLGIAPAMAFLESRAVSRQQRITDQEDEGSVIEARELVQIRTTEGFIASQRDLKARFRIGDGRLRRVLVAHGALRQPGRPRAEERVPRDRVAAAVEVARSRRPLKAKAIEIRQVLGCSERTAYNFLERVRGGRVSSSIHRKDRP